MSKVDPLRGDLLAGGEAPQRAATPLARLVSSGYARIAGISASLVGTQAVTSLLGLVFWALAARQFSTTSVGVAGAAVALMMLLGSLGSLGLGTVLIARLPVTPVGERRLLVRSCLAAAGAGGAVLGLLVPAAAVMVFGASGLAPIAGSPLPLALFALGTALTAAVMVLDQAVLTIGIGNLQFERNVTASAVKIVALLGLGAVGLQGGMVIFAAWAIGNVLSLPLVSWRTRGGRALATTSRLLDARAVRSVGRLAVSHHALNVSIQAALQLLPVIVTVAVSAAANAQFNAAIMLSGFVFALPYAISVGLFAAARGSSTEVLDRMRLTIPFGLAVSVTASAVLFPLAEPLLHIFGPEYAAGGADLLRLVVLAGIPFVIKDHFIALRRVQGRTTQALAVTSVFLVAELAGAVIGALQGGVVGLCIGWLSVLAVEAIVLLVPLVSALRGRRAELRERLGRSAAPVEEQSAIVSPAALERAPSAMPVGSAETDMLELLGSGALEQDTRAVETTKATAADRTADPQSAPRRRSRNLAGPTLLLMSIGVLVMTAAANAGRAGDTGVLPQLTWNLGLVLVFLPAVVRIVTRSTRNLERVVLAIGLAVILQISRIVLNPTLLAFHDELIHLTTLQDITDTGRLFTPNPQLPVSSFYPGLEIVTSGVQQLTGLSAFASAIVTLVIARAVLVLALLALIHLVTRSWRAAALGIVIYVANPQFLFFNSQYSYQTLALPLAVLAVYLFARRDPARRTALVLPLAAAAATVITHHLTAVLLIAAFAGWFVITVVRGRGLGAARARADRRDLLIATLATAAVLVATILNPGNPLTSYLTSIGDSSAGDLLSLAQGRQTKALFADTAGSGPAPWEQALLIAAVLLATVSMLVVLGHIRTSWRAAKPLALLLGLLALLYPLIPGGHVARATAEVGDRASGFVFVGLALVVGAWWWRRRRSGRLVTAFVAGTVVLFLGNIVLGSGPTARQLPGPYEISSDARSADSDNLAAADWLASGVPRDSVVYGDRTSGGLAAAYGHQDAVLHVATNINASQLLLAPTFTSDDVALIRRLQLDYLIVDTRLSDGLPHQQFYIESGEYGSEDRRGPVTEQALTKFAYVPGVQQVYDNGELVIYDLRGLQ